MSTPTRNCDECQHFAYYDGPNCVKGHNPRFYKPTIAVDVKSWGFKRKCDGFEPLKQKENMSTSFKSEWLQPGAVVPVDVQTLAAFAEELRRVNQENEELRQALARLAALYERAANQRDALVESKFISVIRDKLKEKNPMMLATALGCLEIVKQQLIQENMEDDDE